MKKKIICAIVGSIVLMTLGCRNDDTHLPMNFKGYEKNPVLRPGEPGAWDDLYVITAFVLEENGLIYLFYTAYNQTGNRSLGLATSVDGYHFTKFEGNPVLEGDKKGYDAFGVAQAQVLKADTGWILYFNAREIAGFSSGPSFGRAKAPSLYGPWTKSENSVLTAGKPGEWDSDFIYLGTVMKLEDNSYIMYFSGGEDIVSQKNFYTGMATSKDGLTWKKYNDPSTQQHPFADSDPVMMPGKPGEWDANIVLTCMVLKYPIGFGMYYSCGAIGYAYSKDGIHWKRYRKNPVYTIEDDPHKVKLIPGEYTIQGAKLLFRDSICFMYYDYGHGSCSAISVATAIIE